MQNEIYKYGYGKQETNLFQDLFNKYLPYWPLFLSLMLVSGAGAWIYLRYTAPVYEASATILIKDEKKGLDDSKLLESLNIFGPKKIVENEIQVIQSRSLAREVVKNLRLYAPVKEEGRLRSIDAYLFSPILVEVPNPDSLREVKKVYFSYSNNKVVMGKQTYPLNSFVSTPYGVLRFVPNRLYTPDASHNKALYFSLLSTKAAANHLLKNIKVTSSSKQSTVINLAYRDEVPRRAEDVLNELINVYNKAAINDKNSLAANTLSFVEERLKYVVQELDSVEGSLQRFRTANKIVDISSQGQLYLQTVGTNDQKMTDMDMQLAVLDQVENYVVGKSKKGSIVPSTMGINDEVLSKLLEKMYEAELQYEKLKQTTAENNPMMLALKEQIEKIKPNILENIHNQRTNLVASRFDLASSNNKYASMLQKIPQKERELLEISRQQTIKNNIYTFLLQKREETALTYASTVPDSRLVDEGESTMDPVSPNRMVIYLTALIAAICVGIGSISFRELLRKGIMMRSEIEKATTVPILGEVKYDSSKNNIVIAEGKRTFVAEQFRHLRTSLGYLGINSRKKKILVTSTIPAEGKSFVAANLGISLALVGKKVVIVELDLRKPKISSIFNISRSVGVSNYFIGEKDAEDIIAPTAVNANLFVIPSGPLPPNPSELILNGKLSELFSYLESVFDYVIIDTCPVNPVTDAYILSPLCDATLYVIRQGVTPKRYVESLDEDSKIKQLKNIAIIFNGTRNTGFGKYRQSHDYGYGYADENIKPTKKQRKKKSRQQA